MAKRQALRRIFFDRQQGKCYYCKKALYLPDNNRQAPKCTRHDAATWDHKKPKSTPTDTLKQKNKLNRKSNLALACRQCNVTKGDMSEDEYKLLLVLPTKDPMNHKVMGSFALEARFQRCKTLV